LFGVYLVTLAMFGAAVAYFWDHACDGIFHFMSNSLMGRPESVAVAG
jgi:hypothetical protein